jgi:hypothetical protein
MLTTHNGVVVTTLTAPKEQTSLNWNNSVGLILLIYYMKSIQMMGHSAGVQILENDTIKHRTVGTT